MTSNDEMDGSDDDMDDQELMITLRDGKRMVGIMVGQTDHILILSMAKLEGAHGGSTGSTDEPTDTSSWEYAWAQETEGHTQIVVPLSNIAYWSREAPRDPALRPPRKLHATDK